MPPWARPAACASATLFICSLRAEASMPVRITVKSDRALVIVRDASLALPTATDRAALVRTLEAEARPGRLFFLVADDPVRFHLDVYASEALPADIDRGFEDLTGSFLLDVPSGRLVVAGDEVATMPPVPVAPGRHLLTVMTRRPFDSQRYDEEMVALVGAREWRWVRQVDRLGLLGCLPMIATAVTIVSGRWRWVWYVVPILVLSWLPYVVLKRTPRYTSTRRRVAEHDGLRPNFILSLTSTTQGEPLRGGFIRI
jgi:hypothetical protein